MVRAALPTSPEARPILVGTLLSAIGHGLTLPFLYIYLTQVRHLDATVVGFAVGWMGVMGLVLAPLGGTLIDRFGARRVVLPLFVIEAVGVASYGWVHTTWQVFAAATLCAVGNAALWAGQNTILASVTAEEERQRVFGLWFAVLNLGIGIGGLVSGFVVDVTRPATFQLIYVIDGVTFLAPAAILLSMPKVGRRPAEVAAKEVESGGYREVFGDRAFRRFMLFALVLTACGYAQFEVGYTAFSATVAGVSTRVIGFSLAANTTTIVLAQLLMIRRLHGRSRSRALAGVGALFGLSWLLLGLGAAGRGLGLVLPVTGVLLCTVVFAVGETMLSPIMPALTNALAPVDLRGRYNAIGSMIWGVSAVIGPVTAAPLIGHGLGALWVVLVVAGCLVASILALTLRRHLTPAQDGRTPAEPALDDRTPDVALPHVVAPEEDVTVPAAAGR